MFQGNNALDKHKTCVKINTSSKFNRGVKMSTKERYGNEVWRAVQCFAMEWQNGGPLFRTVGEVAREAGVSRGTAKKYLDILVDAGHVSFATTGRGHKLYCFDLRGV